MFPAQLTRFGDAVYFTADNSTHGRELWRTDGTTNGTRPVKDIFPGVSSSHLSELQVFNDRLYFTANDGEHGRELWQSDGTAAGTVLVKDLVPGAASSHPHDFTEIHGTLFFTTSNDDGGAERLWKTDGTAAGTTLVANIGSARELTNVNGILYFSSTSGGRGFWISNGRAAGTQPIVPSDTGLIGYQHLTNVGQLFFAGTDVAHGQELWKLTTANPAVQFSGDLTYKENERLKIIAPWARISDADNTVFFGGRLSVVVAENAGRSDFVEIRNQGNEAGQIGVSGRWIHFGGEVIGSFRAGLPGSQLIIDLNARATVEAAQSLLRNIGYRNTSDNPGTKPRTVVVTLTDGSGGISQPISKTINVIAVNDPPRLVLGGQISYKNNSPPVLLAAAANVSDVDSANFLGGMLSVEVMSARGPSNRLWVSGAFKLQGDHLLHNGVVVGSVIENGFGWNALKLRFNARMTAPLVQELVRSLRFRTFDNTNLDPRTIEFKLTDGDGGVSETRTKTVKLTS